MDRSALQFTLQNLRTAVPNGAQMRHYVEVVRDLTRLMRRFPDVVRQPVTLMPPIQREMWPIQFEMGTGPSHTVFEVIPHGGEPFALAAVVPYVRWLCRHPHLLEGRTIHLLFTSPAESMQNTALWAVRDGVPSHTSELALGVFLHRRVGDPRAQDCWSWNDESEAFRDNGASLGMNIMRDIREAGEQLVLWYSGHNAFLAAGTQFYISGPQDAATAVSLERLAGLKRIKVPLGTHPFESAAQRAHPGTVASANYINLDDLHTHDAETAMHSGPYDWGRRNGFPDMSILAVETEMFGPAGLSLKPWQNMTWGDATRMARVYTRYLAEDLQPVIEFAYKLDPCDMGVQAVLALDAGEILWGKKLVVERDDDELLSPHEAFNVACASPLYQARAAAAGLELIRGHWHHDGRSVAEMRRMFGMLRHAIDTTMDCTQKQVRRKPTAPRLRLQLMAMEIAAYGAEGIHVDEEMWNSLD